MLAEKSLHYQQQVWHLQEQLEQIKRQGAMLEARLEKISQLYAQKAISLLQYNQMVQGTLQGRMKEDIMDDLSRTEHGCQQQIQQLQSRIDEADVYTLHHMNHHKLNTVFLGMILLLLLGLLLGISHPTAYVIFP